LYRTSGPLTEEIVLVRRSRPRAGAATRVVVALLFAAALSITVLAGAHHDQWAACRNVVIALVIVAVGVSLVRTRSLRITRVGRELRIRQGRKRESVLVSEVREVEIDTRGDREHAVVLVLDGHRRLVLGSPFELMSEAIAERRMLRIALTRP
jgi:hypothetical protein